MPRLLDDRLVGLQMADLNTRSFTGVNVGDVVQVAPDGVSLIIAPLPAFAGATGPTGPSMGAAGPTGPAGPAGASTSTSASLRLQLFDTVGTQTWTVPLTTNRVIINAQGGGGGGGRGPAASDEGRLFEMGASGQTGGNVRLEAQVTPGSVITIQVGAGGAGETVSGVVAQSGSNTIVSGMVSPTVVVCNGGQGAPLGFTGVYFSNNASSNPPGMRSWDLNLSGYGSGGPGVSNLGAGVSGKAGAVLIEYVSLT